MIIENVSMSTDELDILKNIIGKKMIRISSMDDTDFLTDFVWTLYVDFKDICIEIDRMDINAALFDIIEDGGRHHISKVQHEFTYDNYTKTINRVVKDVLIVTNIFDFKSDEDNEEYKITYNRAILFQFDDSRLAIEKRWLFSLAGFIVRLESLDEENFGLYNETQFWYDPDNTESDGRIPIVTQIVHSLKHEKDISIKHGLDL